MTKKTQLNNSHMQRRWYNNYILREITPSARTSKTHTRTTEEYVKIEPGAALIARGRDYN